MLSLVHPFRHRLHLRYKGHALRMLGPDERGVKYGVLKPTETFDARVIDYK